MPRPPLLHLARQRPVLASAASGPFIFSSTFSVATYLLSISAQVNTREAFPCTEFNRDWCAAPAPLAPTILPRLRLGRLALRCALLPPITTRAFGVLFPGPLISTFLPCPQLPYALTQYSSIIVTKWSRLSVSYFQTREFGHSDPWRGLCFLHLYFLLAAGAHFSWLSRAIVGRK